FASSHRGPLGRCGDDPLFVRHYLSLAAMQPSRAASSMLPRAASMDLPPMRHEPALARAASLDDRACATRPQIVVPSDCLSMMTMTSSPISVQAVHSGTLEDEMKCFGLDVATEFLFWKEENLALLEMSFPAMDRDLLEDVLIETNYDLGAAVDMIRARVDVINDMDGEVSLALDDMMRHQIGSSHTPHEWVLVTDDWVVVDETTNKLPLTDYTSIALHGSSAYY
ncbi:hypothetical protein SDRG_02350, partial [Saprolegnia diclina VS20]